ncbi:malate dehydrogenase [Halarcobacter mediterraneus]|uniref:Malate dehydrogenase n=1 Tax=Halarcobacter mediterraneus TaxID=2023153 RepID=A0A4V1M1E6_9BACT|nr:malate dehydrogenase [Halarcobacter mediterraneus]RXK13394.1 malate dehydrogenase [Halarcobacter mediterraneus]
MRYKKVGIVGVGNVGSTIAYNLALKNICDEILLKDLREDFTKAMALDISQAASSVNSKTLIQDITKDEEFKACDIVVITAGVPRKPGMSRDDLLYTNAKIMNTIVQNIVKYNEDAILIIVSNPLDAMVYTALKVSKWTRNRVIGMAGILDSSRMAHFIKKKIGNKKVEAMVLGGHGDEMVPLIKETKVEGVSLDEVLNENEINDVLEKTKNGGLEIVKLLKNGSAYYAPAQGVILMLEAILENKEVILPCAVKLEGEFGYENVVTGVPIILGKSGAKKIIEKQLTKKEKEQFSSSISSVKTLIDKLEENSSN